MSWIGTPKSIWPRVTSLYAHDVVQAAFDSLPPTVASNEPVFQNYDYRVWLKHKLAASRLAELLPGGLDLLPDFYAALPAWQRPLAMFSRPKDYSDLVRHLIHHLDWYVDPHQIARAYSVNPLRGLLVLAAPIGVVLWSLISTDFAPFAIMLLGMLLPISVLLSVQPARSMHDAIHAEEFYAYIKEAYSDPPSYTGDGFDLEELADEHRAHAAKQAAESL